MRDNDFDTDNCPLKWRGGQGGREVARPVKRKYLQFMCSEFFVSLCNVRDIQDWPIQFVMILLDTVDDLLLLVRGECFVDFFSNLDFEVNRDGLRDGCVP